MPRNSGCHSSPEGRKNGWLTPGPHAVSVFQSCELPEETLQNEKTYAVSNCLFLFGSGICEEETCRRKDLH